MKSLVDFLKESQIINEAQLYEGGEELCKFISEVIKDNPTKNFIVVDAKNIKNVKNIFFKHLLLYINSETPIEEISEVVKGAKYFITNKIKQTKATLGDLLKWDNNDKMFNYIELYIKTSKEDDRDVDWEDIAHEINHAWDDYEERLKDPERYLGCDIDFDEYKISLNLYAPQDEDQRRSKLELVIGYIKYVTTKFEQKSFSIQLSSKFKTTLEKYKNYEETLKHLSGIDEVFGRYLFMKNEFDKCKRSKGMSQSLCRIYRKNFKKDENLTDQEIIELLDNKFNEFYDAITEDINKILSEYAKKTSL